MRQEDRYHAVCRILNMLKEAVVADSCPKPIEPNDFWINLPEILSYEELIHKYGDEHDDIVMIIMMVISNLHKLKPDEIKPFVIIKQVEEILTKTCDEMKREDKGGKFGIPINKKLMASMIREHFFKTLSIEQTTHEEIIACSELTAVYCEKALPEFVKLIKQKFYVYAVIKFFPLGKTIDIEIDRYYNWGQLCFNAFDYNKLLSIYSGVKELFLTKDVPSAEGKAQDDAYLNVRLQKIIELGGELSQNESYPGGGVKRYLFDSNRDAVVVDGKPILNHLVMMYPYDKPLPDLQEKLNDYARYIGNSVNAYIQEHGQASGYEDEIKNAVAYQNIPFPYKRLSLTDASSVLPNICSLLCFEYERSIDNADRSKKRQTLDVFEMIANQGFTYSSESVESVRKEKEKKMRKVLENLASQ